MWRQATRIEALLERAAADVLHDEVLFRAEPAAREYGDDIGMLESGDDQRFGRKRC